MVIACVSSQTTAGRGDDKTETDASCQQKLAHLSHLAQRCSNASRQAADSKWKVVPRWTPVNGSIVLTSTRALPLAAALIGSVVWSRAGRSEERRVGKEC